jgi:hypothetical protein
MSARAAAVREGSAMKRTIGIDAMACHVPRHYIELEDLASARGIEPAKYLKGLGQRQMAIALQVGAHWVPELTTCHVRF